MSSDDSICVSRYDVDEILQVLLAASRKLGPGAKVGMLLHTARQMSHGVPPPRPDTDSGSLACLLYQVIFSDPLEELLVQKTPLPRFSTPPGGW